MERVLVTGASSWVGGRAVQLLEARPDTTVLAVADADPRLEFSSQFHVMDLDRLEFADLVLDFSPTAVLHLGTLDRSTAVGAERSDRNLVLGAQALFGAIARCPDTTRVIIKSDAAVYGTGPRQPSVVDEESPVAGRGASRRQRRLRDLETFIAAQAQRHGAANYTVLRLATIIGPEVGNGMSRYLSLPAVPTQFGYDPRLQFLHEDDAVAILLHALDDPRPGTFNIAAEGQIYLSRVLRLGRRLQQPLPKRAFSAARRALAASGVHMSDSDVQLLKFGRVMDVGKALKAFGSVPRLTCRQSVLALYERLPENAAHG